MAVRKVEIRVSVDDLDANKRLDSLAAKLDKLTKRVWNIKLRLDDGGTSAKLDRMAARLDKISSRTYAPKIEAKGVTTADAQLDRLNAKLDRIGSKRVTAHVRVDTDRSLFGGIGGAVAGAAGSGAGSGILSALGGANNSYFGGLIAGLAALAAAIAPAIIPFGIGGLAGGGGAILASTLGASGLAKLRADRQALAQAQASLAGARGGGSPSQQLALSRAQARLSRDQAQYGGFVPFGRAFAGLRQSALGSFLEAVTGSSPGFSAGPHGQPGGSFLSGLLPILQQISGFMKSIGPSLGGLFRAALPSLAAFVKIGEQFARAVLPAMTASLKALGPSLPTLVQGFKLVSEGIAGFIRNLGPGMKDAAIIFKAAAMVVKGFLQLLGAAASGFAIAIVKTAETVRAIARAIPRLFDTMRHSVASIFDNVRHSIAAAWDAIWSNTIGRVSRGISTVVGWFRGLPGKVKDALSSLGGILFSIGKAVLQDFLNGLKAIAGPIISFVQGIASTIGGILGSIGGAIHSVGGFAGKLIPHAAGGLITEPIIGRGLRSGAIHTFGENGLIERVTPLGAGGGAAGGDVYNVNVTGDFMDPDATALRVIQAIRKFKQHHGNKPTGIG